MSPSLARDHEVSTFALTCTAATLVGVPAGGALVLALVSAWFGIWPDIDMAGSAVTRGLCLLRYPVWALDEHHLPVRHTKGRKKGRIRLVWRSFPGHQIHLAAEAASRLVFDACATPADRADVAGSFGMKFRSHRGLTHSVWWALGTGLAVWLLGPVLGHLAAPWLSWIHLRPVFGTDDLRGLLAETAVVGVLGHILGDCCTDYACAPFAPVWRWNGRRYVEMGLPEPMRFKVNHWVERALVTKLCAVAAALSVLYAFGALSATLRFARGVWLAL